ncbi:MULTISPECIES: Crp/Fnr family transcriptional regulator [unclassified Fusibacter]|uniref:Crp/Fnr family transcriptional regulator n=1 Tax=unclassified Fusibacter TaxID=2624464 RepID=UPI0010114854|nr:MULTISPECIES: Crp/Fnr family transcriptional regulator [unclassified Fusibacter]MCK8061492.1 Crp/Fnr family transcriptional regulator [Fusibacter sp. A2]NPE23677.1 Crp/Fnr family transcriptional regulator [Fusibacter sp. A1]RXV58856.1 Crp/Fnr family transcriptional regulator [Fusibacter sp. A1]
MIDVLINYMKRFIDLPEEELYEIAKDVPIQSFEKGSVLIRQGEVPTECFFVLQGLVRQYAVNEDGKETTFNFFTEEQAVAVYNAHTHQKESKFTLRCSEDCVLVVGDLSIQDEMFAQFEVLETMVRKVVENDIGAMNEAFTSFVASTPEERFKNLMETRPDLFDRVPNHQLASYLGITPESFSRIKKRLNQER